jgi:hypothetical protein
MTTATPATTQAMIKHAGGCHCGQVRFEVELDLGAGGSMCNCTVCTKIATVAAIVKPDAFRQVSGEDSLSTYEWGGKISRRKFCKHCGVHCFAFGHLAELGGDYVSVSLNCLDDFDLAAIAIRHWDGRHNNWEGGMRATPWPIQA